jgi:hypothetical protein
MKKAGAMEYINTAKIKTISVLCIILVVFFAGSLTVFAHDNLRVTGGLNEGYRFLSTRQLDNLQTILRAIENRDNPQPLQQSQGSGEQPPLHPTEDHMDVQQHPYNEEELWQYDNPLASQPEGTYDEVLAELEFATNPLSSPAVLRTLLDNPEVIRFFQQSAQTDTSEVTFDEYRTITGAANEGSLITAYVFSICEDGSPRIFYASNTVGASRVFSLDLGLEVADNIVILISTLDQESSIVTTTIRRMAPEIRLELENRVPVLPGRHGRDGLGF